jgi:hypothetical protein
MKTSNILIPCGLALLMLSGCQKTSKIDYGKALDMGISLQGKVLQKNSPNILTISLENTSKHKLFVPESSFLLEFTSYSGSIKKTYYLDLSNEKPSITQTPQTRFEIKGKSEITRNIDLKSIVTDSPKDSESGLPVDDYAINLIMNLKPGTHNSKKDEIRSNYIYIQVKS